MKLENSKEEEEEQEEEEKQKQQQQEEGKGLHNAANYNCPHKAALEIPTL